MSDDDRIYPPINGKVQRIAVSAVSSNTALIAGLAGTGWLRLAAVGADVDILFGSASEAALVKNQTGNGNGVGVTIPSGQFQDFYMPGTAFPNIVAIASGSGFLVVSRSGRDRVPG